MSKMPKICLSPVASSIDCASRRANASLCPSAVVMMQRQQPRSLGALETVDLFAWVSTEPMTCRRQGRCYFRPLPGEQSRLLRIQHVVVMLKVCSCNAQGCSLGPVYARSKSLKCVPSLSTCSHGLNSRSRDAACLVGAIMASWHT